MAENDSTPQVLTPDIKLKIYELLAGTNRGFAEIADTCRELEQTAVFRTQQMSDFQGLIQELQSEINSEILSNLTRIEEEDAARFGRVRIERDNRLRGD